MFTSLESISIVLKKTTLNIITDQTIQDLIYAAVKAKDNAYCPYSDFHVGSAVLTEDGHIFSGND